MIDLTKKLVLYRNHTTRKLTIDTLRLEGVVLVTGVRRLRYADNGPNNMIMNFVPRNRLPSKNPRQRQSHCQHGNDGKERVVAERRGVQ